MIKKNLNRIRIVLLSVGIKGILGYSKLLISNLCNKNSDKRKKESEIVLLTLPLDKSNILPIGIASIKAYLKKQNIDCFCIDFNNIFYNKYYKKNINIFNKNAELFLSTTFMKKSKNKQLEKITSRWADYIIKKNPKYVGISLNSSAMFFSLKYLVQLLKEKNKNITIIIGGPSSPENAKDLLKNGIADIVVDGEGEITISKIIQALNHNKSLKTIKGITYKKGNKIIKNPEYELIKDINNMPFPDYSDFKLKNYQKGGILGHTTTIPILTSKGCSQNCKFCNNKSYFLKARNKSAKMIFQEMKHFKKNYGSNDFLLCNSRINGDFKILHELCDLLIKNREIYNWSSYFSILPGNTKALIKKMAKAGCYSVSIGIESGSERIRHNMNKTFSNDLAKKQISLMSHYGIDIHLSFIIGYPKETNSDFNETINFLLNNKKSIDSARFSLCVISPGSNLHTNYKKKGIQFDKNHNWYLGKNTMEERIKRLNLLKDICKKEKINCSESFGIKIKKISNFASKKNDQTDSIENFK